MAKNIKPPEMSDEEIAAFHKRIKENVTRYRILLPYLRALNEEICNIRIEVTKGLKRFAEIDNFSIWNVNGAQLGLRDLTLAAYIVIKEQPWHGIFSDNEWLMNHSDIYVRMVFEKLEKYLKKLPGAKLPEKDPLVQKWWDKLEKKKEEENKNER